MISPTSLRSTASGLQRTRVRSSWAGTLPGRSRRSAGNGAQACRNQDRSGRADRVQRAGDDHLAVGRRDRRAPARPRRPRESTTSICSRSRPEIHRPRSRPVHRVERARARRARVHTRRVAASTPSASSISCGSFSRRSPTTSVRGPAANSSSSAARSACAPATLCAPSSRTSGWWPTTSSRPGRAQRSRTPPRRRPGDRARRGSTPPR